MSENQKQTTVFAEPKQKWSVPQSMALIGVSLLILGAVFMLVRLGLLQRLFAYAAMLVIPAAAFWAGLKLYVALADQQPRYSGAPRARNWGPLIASIVMGIAVALGVSAIFSHQTARALDSIVGSDSDNNSWK